MKSKKYMNYEKGECNNKRKKCFLTGIKIVRNG